MISSIQIVSDSNLRRSSSEGNEFEEEEEKEDVKAEDDDDVDDSVFAIDAAEVSLGSAANRA